MLAVQTAPALLSDFERRAEAFWQAEVSALYHVEAGLDDGQELASIYEMYADLFSKEQVLGLIELARTHADSHTRHMAEFTALRYLRSITRPYDEAFFGQLGQATTEWEGEPVPFFALTPLLTNEPDAQRRRRLYDGRSRLVAQNNANREERWQAVASEVTSWGFGSYFDLYNELRDLRLLSLQAAAETFLQATAVVYFQALSKWGQRWLNGAAPKAADMFYLLRGASFDHLFPQTKLDQALYETAAFMGFYLKQYPALEIDLEARPHKAPRPFCAFIQVPHNIKLVVNPSGGYQDYQAALHELGHALHGLHIPAELPFASRYLGDESVGEAYAFLFEQLSANPIWQQEVLRIRPDEPFKDYMQFTRLLLIRRCAAKVLYENQLHRGEEDPNTLYADLLQTHLGLDVSPAYYLLDVEDGFYNAQYFRAWILAAQITRQLENQIGFDWPLTPATGIYLRRLWEKGQPSAEIIAIHLGEEGLNVGALIDSFLG